MRHHKHYLKIKEILYFAALFGVLCLPGCAVRDRGEESGVVYMHEQPDPFYWDEVGLWPGPVFIEDHHDYVHYKGRLYHRRPQEHPHQHFHRK